MAHTKYTAKKWSTYTIDTYVSMVYLYYMKEAIETKKAQGFEINIYFVDNSYSFIAVKLGVVKSVKGFRTIRKALEAANTFIVTYNSL